jgi:AcrR family transcriptional regulator
MRKLPRQARSRQLVEAILEAGARILSDGGWAAFNTNAVAERAGVSIGSLYQYFPDKLALIAAIRSRHLDDCLTALSGLDLSCADHDESAPDLVDALIAAHSRYPGLHRVLLDDAPSAPDHLDPESAYEKAYLGLYAKALNPDANEAPDDRGLAAALVLSDAVDGVIHNAARRGQLNDPAIRYWLVLLVNAFLARYRQTQLTF